MLTPLIDADILRYEIGFGAETGWRQITEDFDAIPPFDYVAKMLTERIAHILDKTNPDTDPKDIDYRLFLSEGECFRSEIAVTKEYKGNRSNKKPFHFDNLTAYIEAVYNTTMVGYPLEADDLMAMYQCEGELDDTVICSRDKDMRQVPGWVFSWELGRQPEFFEKVDEQGYIRLSPDRKKIEGCGNAFFWAQMLMGDTADNVPGLQGYGAVKTFDTLESGDSYAGAVTKAYMQQHPDDWGDYITEQGRLLWLCRGLHADGKPIMWEWGMGE